MSYETVSALIEDRNRLRVENDRLRAVLKDILEEATYDGEDEPDEDVMIEALCTIHSYASVALQ